MAEVLIQFKERRRTVKLPRLQNDLNSLKDAAIIAYQDVLKGEIDHSKIYFQKKDESWGGLFVDIHDDELIHNRSILQMNIEVYDLVCC